MPRAVSHRRRAASDTRTPAYAGPVLLVDDEPGFLDSLTLLETRGFRVLTARDGARGPQMFRAHSPVVVVTDIMMPEEDGIGAMLQMRRERPGVTPTH